MGAYLPQPEPELLFCCFFFFFFGCFGSKPLHKKGDHLCVLQDPLFLGAGSLLVALELQ